MANNNLQLLNILGYRSWSNHFLFKISMASITSTKRDTSEFSLRIKMNVILVMHKLFPSFENVATTTNIFEVTAPWRIIQKCKELQILEHCFIWFLPLIQVYKKSVTFILWQKKNIFLVHHDSILNRLSCIKIANILKIKKKKLLCKHIQIEEGLYTFIIFSMSRYILHIIGAYECASF